MRILLVSDDGIDSAGLNVLAESLSLKHEIFIIAPKNKRSCASQSISLGEISYETQNPGKFKLKVAISGSPADAVKLAVLYFMKDNLPDAIICGINDASNLGAEIMYSGTVGAAFEGAYLGLPAVAVSMADKNFTEGFYLAAKFIQEYLDKLRLNNLPKNSVLNINHPACPSKGVKFCKTYVHYYTDHYVSLGKNKLKLEGNPIFDIHPDSDVMLCNSGYITLSLLSLNRNDDIFFEKYKALVGDILD